MPIGNCDRKNLLPIFKDQIEEGSTYVLEKFMVAQNDPTFKTIAQKYKLNFMGGTNVFKVNATEIPERLFKFFLFLDILATHKEDRLLDVIGHVVEKDTIKETVKDGKSNKVLDATLEDLEGNRIHCTMWDDYAVKMQHCLDTHDSSLPMVVIFQLCKLKKYYGVMGYGTKMMVNPNIPEVSDYIERMNDANVEHTSC